MTRVSTILVLLLIGLQFSSAFAQCQDNAFELLDGNNVSARFQNGGNLFWDMSGNPAYEVPKGGGVSATFASGIWLGGLDTQGNLHVAASTYRQNGWDWYAGPSTDAVSSCENTIASPGDIFINGIKQLSNGKVLVLTSNEIIVYNPQSGAILTRPLPATRAALNAIELPDGRIFMYGDDNYPTKNPSLLMDTVNYTIVGGPTLQWFHQESSADLLPNGKVLIAGIVGCEVYDPLTNISTVVPDMLYARTKHCTTTMPNGDIMAFGGGNSLGGTGATLYSQRFDAVLGYWFPGPVLSVPRQRAQATKMLDGTIWISGGSVFNTVTQFYDAIADSLLPAAPLPFKINAHTVSVIDSHRVLIASADVFPGKLFTFNVHTGAFQNIGIQLVGNASMRLDSATAFVQVKDAHQLQRINFKTNVQDDDRWQYVWKLNRSQIDQFKADFLANQVDFTQYPQVQNWPAHGNEALGEDRNLAPFVDVNQDGLYRPAIDGDYPCIVGDQALWWVMNDAGPHEESNGRPLGMQVEAMAYAFDCSQTVCPDTSLEYTTMLHLEITNHSDTAYHDMYVGSFHDTDLGSYADDFIGSDSSLSLAFVYNGDNDDSPGYGINPPAWGVSVLPNGQLGSMAGMMRFVAGLPTYNSQPLVGLDHYNYLRSRFLDSLHLVNNGLDGYPGTAPGPQTNFLFPSTDGFCGGAITGWNEITANNAPYDRNMIESTGPFSLQPGESIQWDIALIYARDSSNLLSVCRLKSATAAIQNWWQNQLDRGCFSTVVAREEPQITQAFQVYPNPSGDGRVTLDLGQALLADGQLEVMDMQGRRLQVRALPAGAQRYQVQLQDLPAGMYLLRVQDESHSATQRLIVQH